ncbi:MAG: hypothetical protein RLZ81_1593 [Pseudomonadota bacterium]|jgi:hypothetical protein
MPGPVGVTDSEIHCQKNDMTASILEDAPTPKQVPASRRPATPPLWRRDSAIYLLLVGLTWGAWRFSRLGLFKAGDDAGYWIGVAGGVMMLLLFGYPLRKHLRFTQNWGRMKWWFWLHMTLGIGGPLLILVHSTFRIGSLNAGVALYSMIIVALSGVVGRFIYRHVNKGLRGEEITLKELQAFARMHQDDARSRLAFAPAVEARLKAFEQAQLGARPGWVTYLRQVLWLPVQRWRTLRACDPALKQALQALAPRKGWREQDVARHHRLALKLVRSYLDAVVGVAQFTAYERLFALWHVAHIPFVYLLIVSAIVHVVAVHAY